MVTDNFRKAIESAINRASAENGSDTPDFILAEFLLDALAAFDKATIRRSKWYGETVWSKRLAASAGTGPTPNPYGQAMSDLKVAVETIPFGPDQRAGVEERVKNLSAEESSQLLAELERALRLANEALSLARSWRLAKDK